MRFATDKLFKGLVANTRPHRFITNHFQLSISFFKVVLYRKKKKRK